MAINNEQFERLKTLFTNDSKNIADAKILFEKLIEIKKEYDTLIPARVTEIKIIDVDKKEFLPNTSLINLNNIVKNVKDELEEKYAALYRNVSDLLIKKNSTTPKIK